MHLRIIGERATGRRLAAELPISCHRLRRGPFTGAGSLLLDLVPRIQAQWPDLVAEHRYAILTVAPGLVDVIGAAPVSLTAQASWAERTRFESGLARRASHGITELLVAYAKLNGPFEVGFDAVHEADPTDQEFLAILLRRADPRLVAVRLGTTAARLPHELAAAVDVYTEPVLAPAAPTTPRSEDSLLRAYVEAGGTSDDPAELNAWLRADPRERAALHDAAAQRLGDEIGLRAGALPYHREHGSDPADVEALELAAQHCVSRGFFAAAAELAARGCALTGPAQREHSAFQAIQALCLRRDDPELAESILLGMREDSALPHVRMATAYSLAMLYTTFHAPERQNLELARTYARSAVAVAADVEDPEERAFSLSFHQNGLALVELRSGRPEEAIRLVTAAIEVVERELPETRFRQHRAVLFSNRARAYQSLGRLEEAKVDLDSAVSRDPNHPEYHYDRANLARLRGDDEAAAEGYEQAMRLSAPFLEPYYSRGDLRAGQGDVAGAIADFGYVLELEPDHLDARINRAALLAESGDLESAAADVEAGLAIDRANAHLLCTSGLLAMEHADHAGARAYFSQALAADETLRAALVNSAILDYDEGDFDSAVAKLTRAIEQAPDDPDLWFNRGFAHQAAGRFDDAAADYRAALYLPGADRAELLHQIGLCTAR